MRDLRQGALLLLLLMIALPDLSARSVILISVDTLRADRLSCYGYQANRTPNFDRWAEEGIRFEHAYSENPLTLPAHVTMLTGLYPNSHGIRENMGFRLEEEFLTLAECFRAGGYATAGFVGSYVLASEFGVAQGFQVFDERFDRNIESVMASTELQRPAEEVTDRFLAWLEQNRPQKFFAFVHFYDPHTPRPRGYDWEVSQVDRNLGRIDRYLRENGLLEATHLVVTSDHGESLGEHGESGHGFFVYDSTLHVPLIIRPAAAFPTAGRAVSEPVSLADLMPTILEMAGLNLPVSMQGRSLVRLLQGGNLEPVGLYAESLVPALHFGWSRLRSLRQGSYKFIEAPNPELYDLQADPSETHNLYVEKIETGREYRSRLEAWLAIYETAPARTGAGVTPEVLERLASLGYVSPGAAPSAGSSRADPKDRIEAFELYHSILNRASGGAFGSELLADVERLPGMAPEMRGVDFLRAWALEGLGRLEEARRHYQLSVEKDPDNLLSRNRYATLLLRMGAYEDAERQLVRILEKAPGDYKSRNNLAGLYHRTGRGDLAVTELRKILDARPGYAAAWQNLGNLLLAAGDWRGAEEAFRRLVELDPRSAAAHFQLSRTLEAQGRATEALRERELAFELDPRLRNLP